MVFLKRLMVLLVCCSGIPFSIHAQNDFVLWLDYNLAFKQNKMVFGGDVGARGWLTSPDVNQYVIRPTIWYKPSTNLTIGGAAGLFSTILKDKFNYYEFRLQQEAVLKWPNFNWGSIVSRLRIDERFFTYSNPERTDEFNGRIRPLLGFKTKSFDVFSCKKPLYFQMYWEGFQNFDEAAITEIFVNNTRLYLSFGQKISKRFRYEIHYIWQQSGVFNDFGLQTQQHILRLRFFYIAQ